MCFRQKVVLENEQQEHSEAETLTSMSICITAHTKKSSLFCDQELYDSILIPSIEFSRNYTKLVMLSFLYCFVVKGKLISAKSLPPVGFEPATPKYFISVPIHLC